MQATPSLQTGFAPDASARINLRIATVAGIVIGLHVVALAIAFTVREVAPLRPIESRTITAELIPPAPDAEAHADSAARRAGAVAARSKHPRSRADASCSACTGRARSACRPRDE